MRSRLHVASVLLLVSVSVFAGCAPRSGYGYGGYGRSSDANAPYAGRSNASPTDERYCRRVAEDVSGDIIPEGAKGALVGGALGAAVGAAAGAIAGSPGKGAAIGAVTGGVGGAVVQGTRRNQGYDEVFASCMRDQGYRAY